MRPLSSLSYVAVRMIARHSLAIGAGVAVTTAPFLAITPAFAGQYEALCGGSKCTIVVTPTEIRSPYGAIPTKRVTYWGSTGDSKTSVGTGVATTILTGGIGLLGFLAKNHQYDFTVNGYDATGKQATMQIEFKNNKPAKRLMNELVVVTGLGMGQTRTLDEIKKIESGEIDKLGGLQTAPSGLGAVKSAEEQAAIKAEATKNCWSKYLDSNPAMKKWAEANPTQAEQNKKRFDDC